MERVSNKTIAFALLFFLVISVGSTIFSLYKIKIAYAPGVSGFATGTVDVQVTGLSSVTVNTNVDFGQSQLRAGNITVITTETNHSGDGLEYNTTFNNCSNDVNWSNMSYECRGIEIENDGNVYLNITLSASSSANAFWSGDNTTDEFDYATLDGNRSHGESGSCNNNSNIGNTSSYYNLSIYPKGSTWTSSSNFFYNWSTIPTTATLVCTNLSFTDSTDTITIEFNLTIPSDETTGSKQNTFTITATQI